VQKRPSSRRRGIGCRCEHTHSSLCELLRKPVYLHAICASTDAKASATSGHLRIWYDALDVLYIWTRAVHGLGYADEGVRAKILRAGNYHKKQVKDQKWRSVDDDSTYDFPHALPTAGRQTVDAVVVVVVVVHAVQTPRRRIGIGHLRVEKVKRQQERGRASTTMTSTSGTANSEKCFAGLRHT
jgi:hypothetical protein